MNRIGEKPAVVRLRSMFVFATSVRADGAGYFKAKCAACHGRTER